MASDYDIILVGGGLANGLISDRLLAKRPDLRLLVLDEGRVLGGNHTWSFHDTDLTAAQHKWLAPYVAHRWPRQEVRFDGFNRVLDTGYCSVPSERFHDVLVKKLGVKRMRLATPAVDVAAGHVVLADQTRLTADCVVDGRGPRPNPALALGFQKFIGREVETSAPHGLAHPILMDATVSQKDGYRFVYSLPLSPTRLLIEDTYYADGAALDLGHLHGGIDAYAKAQGWHIARDVRQEHGVLPIVLAGEIDRFWSDVDVPRVGLRAGLFHPTTGYSLPDAVRLAEHVAACDILTSSAVGDAIRTYAKAHWQERGFFRLLNRLLFLAASGDERVGVMARFYRLPEPLIRRFYAADLTLADQVRILTGKPPVPITRALPCLGTGGAWAFARDNESGR
jgi:lycopene beta-cyclase